MTAHTLGPLRTGATIAATALLLATGCATGSVRGTEPEAMSRDEHEAAARREEEYARGAEIVADPGATPRRFGDASARAEFWREHAEAHRRAAAVLEARHEAACEGFSEEEMATCPFERLAGVTAVQDVPSGVRLRLAPEAPARIEALLAHARCHAAHGADRGKADMPDCPLYEAGLRVDVIRDDAATWLFLTTDDAAAVPRLRARVRSLFPPER